MAETAAEARSKLGRATSNVFLALFALAAVIAAGATYLAVTDESPVQAGQPGLLWLLIANLIIIASLATVFGARVLQLIRENRETDGGARLRLRIIFLFSLAAAIPTVIVAAFLAVTINRSSKAGSARPVTNIVEGGAQAARAALDDFSKEAQLEAQSIVSDIAATAPSAASIPIKELEFYLQDRSGKRGIFRRLEAFDGAGVVLFQLIAEGAAPPMTPTTSDWSRARAGEISVREDTDGAIRAFFKVPKFDNVYVQAVADDSTDRHGPPGPGGPVAPGVPRSAGAAQQPLHRGDALLHRGGGADAARHSMAGHGGCDAHRAADRRAGRRRAGGARRRSDRANAEAQLFATRSRISPTRSTR